MRKLQNDRMTDRTKTICPPIFDLGGIKMDGYIESEELRTLVVCIKEKKARQVRKATKHTVK